MMIKEARLNSVDGIRGCAIILMVLAHAGCPARLREVIYLFHMPVFFILAGYLYKDEYTRDLGSVSKFFIKRVKRLWVPYVVWASAFLFLHNLFVQWHIYPDGPGSGGILEGQGICGFWSVGKILDHFSGIPLMVDGAFGMAGAFWFLRVLFWSSLLYVIVDYCRRTINVTDWCMSFFALCAILSARYWVPRPFLPVIGFMGGKTMLTSFALIHLGVVLRKSNLPANIELKKWRVPVMLIGSAMLYFLSCFGSVRLGGNQYPSILFLLSSSFLGWFILRNFAEIAGGGRMLANIGKHTMPIMIFHFLSFKLVSAIGAIGMEDAVSRISAYPVGFTGGCWFVLYTLVGVALPLLLNHYWRIGCDHLFDARR